MQQQSPGLTGTIHTNKARSHMLVAFSTMLIHIATALVLAYLTKVDSVHRVIDSTESTNHSHISPRVYRCTDVHTHAIDVQLFTQTQRWSTSS